MAGKRLYGFGDSLVEGHCVRVGMLDALAQKHGMAYCKYARNGATMIPDMAASREDKDYVPDVAAQIEAASEVLPDFICFDGLTNDAWPQIVGHHLGQISGSYDGEYDRTSFCGAFEHACFLLQKKYGDSRIFYVCVHKMPSRDMETQETLHAAARKICRKWSIPFIDVFRQGQINTCIEEMRVRYSYNDAACLTGGNGTHLNPDGYEKWYLPLIENAMKRYL